MPYSIRTKDGIVISDIPDDLPKDAPELRQRVAEMREQGVQSATYDQPAQTAPQPSQMAQDSETTVGGLTAAGIRGASPVAIGAGLGTAMGGFPAGTAAGAAIAGLTTLVGDPITQLANNIFGTQFATPTEAIQQILTTLGVPEPDTAAERIFQQTVQGTAESLGGVGLGRTLAGAATPTMQRAGEVMASQPVQQAAAGGGASLAAGTVGEMGAGPVTQVGAGLLGGLGAGRAAGLRVTPTERAALPSEVAEAEAMGIPVMTTDVVPPRTFMGKAAQATGERLPFGTAGMRERQQESRVQAIRDLLQSYGATDVARLSQNVMDDLMAQRGAKLTRFTDMKRDVIDRLSAQGVPTVPMMQTIDQLDQEILRLKDLNVPEMQPLINRAEGWRDALAEGKSLDQIEDIRKVIGDQLGSQELANVKSQGQKVAERVYRAVNEDMGDHIKRYGEPKDFTKWKVANTELSSMIGELRSSALKTALNKGDFQPEQIRTLIFSKKPSEIRQLYSGLSQEGKRNARSLILAEVMEKTRVTQPDGTVYISPERFVNELNKLDKPMRQFFTGQDNQAIRGLVRALQLTSRASQAGVAPPTGVQVVPFVAADMLSNLFGGPLAATSMAIMGGVAARGAESSLARDILLKIAKAPKGTPQEAELFKRLVDALRTQTAGRPEAPEE